MFSLVAPIILIGLAVGRVICVARFLDASFEPFPKYVSEPQVQSVPSDFNAKSVFNCPLTAITLVNAGLPEVASVTRCHLTAFAAVIDVIPVPVF